MPSHFKDRLASALRDRKWIQKDLADRLHVKPPTVSRWLSGENIPRTGVAHSIARELGISPEWLLNGDPAEKSMRLREDAPGELLGKLGVSTDLPTVAESSSSPLAMSAQFLPPPSPGERAVMVAARSLNSAQTARYLADVLEDRETPAATRYQHANRLLYLLSEKLEKENPAHHS